MNESAGLHAAISITGRCSAMSLGLALTPVSRHSALGSFFKLTFNGTQAFHMMVSYLLISLVLLHALLYIYWVGYWKTWPADQQTLFPVYNPTYNASEVYPGNKTTLGRYRASLVFTGGAATFIMLMIFITSIRLVRQKWFRIFYWVHSMCVLAIILASLHSSTVFQCIAPGVLMWLLDKFVPYPAAAVLLRDANGCNRLMRIYELYGALYGTITPLGKGWYLLSCPLPRTRLEGCACSSPVARFYIYHDSAIRQLHPITTITHLALEDAITDPTENSINIEFLFRRHGGETPFVSVKRQGWSLLDAWRKPKNSNHDIYSRIGSERSERRVREQDSFALFDLESREPITRSVASQQSRTNHGSEAFEPIQEGSADVEALRPAPKRKNKAEMLMDNASVPTSLRLEGPFFTPANPSNYHTVVCLVEGAGVSGALAIASAFQQLERFERKMLGPERSEERRKKTNYDMSALSSNISEGRKHERTLERKWRRCLIVWVVPEEEHIELPGLQVPAESSLEVRIHLTGPGRKAICYYNTLDIVLERDPQGGRTTRGIGVDENASVWVYVSGSETFVGKAEKACKSRQSRGVEWTCAEIAV